MRTSVVILALLLSGCGIKVEHDVKGHVDPIEIKHYVVLDTTKLEGYYRSECEKQFATEPEITDCTNEELAKFLKQFTFTS